MKIHTLLAVYNQSVIMLCLLRFPILCILSLAFSPHQPLVIGMQFGEPIIMMHTRMLFLWPIRLCDASIILKIKSSFAVSIKQKAAEKHLGIRPHMALCHLSPNCFPTLPTRQLAMLAVVVQGVRPLDLISQLI